jgi:hypothetical protein
MGWRTVSTPPSVSASVIPTFWREILAADLISRGVAGLAGAYQFQWISDHMLNHRDVLAVLRREQRYLEHQLEAEQRKLAQFELFITLIEHGSSKDDACELVHNHFADEASPEAVQASERPAEAAEASAGLPATRSATTSEPLPPKAWRAALFTGVLPLFGWEAQYLNQNSRGLANKAAMLLQESGICPEQLPQLKQLFEQAYPTVKRYTPIALANHCTEFAAAL